MGQPGAIDLAPGVRHRYVFLQCTNGERCPRSYCRASGRHRIRLHMTGEGLDVNNQRHRVPGARM